MANGKSMPRNNFCTGNVSDNKKRKLWKRSFLFVIILLILSVCIFFVLRKCTAGVPGNIVKEQDIVPCLQHGDIILRSGTGFWSELFRSSNSTDKRFSHVGIVVVDNGEFKVLHSEGNDFTGEGNVRLDSLAEFIAASDGVGISRLKNGNPDEFVQAAVKYLDRPFDWKFNKDNDREIYCTELIDLALKSSGISSGLKVGSNGIFLPESCLDTEYFYEVKLNN